jgi:hypothetical protein
VEILKAGSLSPPLVIDLLLRGKAVIPGVEIVGKRIGSREMVIGFDADTVYAVRVGTTPSEVLLEALLDLAWLKEEESMVQAIFPQATRPSAGIILTADLFPPGFSSLLRFFAFPCRLFRSIALSDQPLPCLLFEPYPPQVAEGKTDPEGTTEEEERFFSSW